VDAPLWRRRPLLAREDDLGDDPARKDRQASRHARAAQDDGDRIGAIGADPQLEAQVHVIVAPVPGSGQRVRGGLLVQESPVGRSGRIDRLPAAGEMARHLGQGVLCPVGRDDLVHRDPNALVVQHVAHLLDQRGRGEDRGRGTGGGASQRSGGGLRHRGDKRVVGRRREARSRDELAGGAEHGGDPDRGSIPDLDASGQVALDDQPAVEGRHGRNDALSSTRCAAAPWWPMRCGSRPPAAL
jgi:hypothetical protein